MEKQNTLTPLWILPDTEGVYEITLTISNFSGSDSKTRKILVKDLNQKAENLPVIYFPFNGDTQNHSQNRFHAVSVEAFPTEDARGIEKNAFKFSSANEYIYVPNDAALNFNEKIAISFWIKPDFLPNSESYIISHGSWEERYKISVIPSKNLRWSLKTNENIIDIDDPEPLETGKFVHYVGQYTGYSLELYRNGKLVAYNQHNGIISTTDKNITFSRKDENETNYYFRGTIDEVRIYDTSLSLSEIEKLPDLWSLTLNKSNKIIIFPNPVEQNFNILIPHEESIKKIEIINLFGQTIWKRDNL